MSERFVLRWRKPGAIDKDDIRQVAELPGVEIHDQSAKMLLVNGDEATLRAFAEAQGGWALLSAEPAYVVPDPRHKVVGPG